MAAQEISGLTLTVNRLGFNNISTFHRISFGPRDHTQKSLQLIVKIYSSEAYADSNPGDAISTFKITIRPRNSEDYDTYFGGSDWSSGAAFYPENNAYAFLRAVGSNYQDTYDYSTSTIVYKSVE